MYNIQVKRKKVKNITIRVQSEDLVTVTAPTYIRDSYIDELVKKRSKWIEEKINLIKNQSISKENTLDYLGESYDIQLIYSHEEKIMLKDEKAYIYSRKIDDANYTNYLIKKWYYEESEKIFRNLIEKYEIITGKKVSVVRIKPMKTRWGSCNTVKAYINLNLNLIEKPMECIEYVVLHEFAHLTHPNHRKEFWDYVRSYMSDFEERKQKLR